MVGSNKILTVSYGTFSCTLEGFEDSFGTMKAIAEYFRDLAADDRYFGAVPPVPDAEMLARIAEREIERRVEARMDASGIVLRVGQAIDKSTAPAPTDSAAGPAVPEPTAAPVAAFQPVAAAAPVETPLAPLMPPAPIAPRQVEPLVARMAEPRVEKPTEPLAEITAPAKPAHPDADSVAAKLQRIRAVVGRNSAGFAASNDNEEDTSLRVRSIAAETFDDLTETAPLAAPVAVHPVATAPVATEIDVAAILAEVAADAAANAAITDTVIPEEEPVVSETVKFVEISAAEVESEAEVVVAEDDADNAPQSVGDSVAAAPGPIRARVVKMRRSDFNRAVAMGVLVEDQKEPTADDAATDLATKPATIAETASDTVAEIFEDDFTAESLAEDDYADSSADLDDLARLDGMTPALAPISGTSTLSAADEAELLAELEAVEREAALFTEEGEAAVVESIDEAAQDNASSDVMLVDAATLDPDPAEEVAPNDAPDFSDDIAIEDEAFEDTPLALEAFEDEVIEDAALDDTAFKDAAFDDVAVDVEPLEDDVEPTSDTDLALMNIMAQVAESGPTDAEDETADVSVADTELADLTDAIRMAAFEPTVTTDARDNENLFVEDLTDEAVPELATDADEAFDTAEAVAAETIEPEPAVAHSHLRAEPEADEAALSRIMSEADAQLSEPEASRRREAIAQLRAAVAATEAARRLGEAPAEADTSAEEAFRDDLQQVVRPRRPMTPTAEVRSERPRPAPLKLVASQRVDLPQAAPRNATAPIRPRRVTLAADEPTSSVTLAPVASPAAGQNHTLPASRSQASSFAEFASEMGATSLADLLEAAAAYTAFVEGSEDFSRPQLLKKVTQMVPDQFSREDGLRSFGTLLREGRIMRTRTGRFQVSEETRFNPERRAG